MVVEVESVVEVETQVSPDGFGGDNRVPVRGPLICNSGVIL